MAAPPPGTVERWAFDYVASDDLAHKLAPPAPPDVWEPDPPARRLEAPGRPVELEVVSRAPRARPGSARGRARLIHTFLHHELQAAELMAWALLAFPDAPRPLREGLLRIALDEIRHMGMYEAHLRTLGRRFGDFPVRDWFWERVPSCASAASYLAVMGLGFEAGNLDHAGDFARRFRDAGDDAGAAVQERVGREEVAHVRFAARWFAELEGELAFARWASRLPSPLSPGLMRGATLDRAARARAGLDDAFLDELDTWSRPGS